MRGYGLGFNETLALPLKRFWFLLAQLSRLEAQDDLRLMRNAASATSGEAYEAATKHFEGVIGEIYNFDRTEKTVMRIDPETGLDPEFDRAGLHALKEKFGRG